MGFCTNVKMALRPCDSIDSDVQSGSNSSDMSSKTSDNLVFVSKEGSLQLGHTLGMKLMHNK